MEPYLDIGFYLTISYFLLLLVFFPLANIFDRFIYDVYMYSSFKSGNKIGLKNYYAKEFTSTSFKKKF